MYAFEKFWPYLLGTKVVVHIDHVVTCYLMSKKEGKSRLIRRVLFLHEFDFELKDQKGSKNQVADHFSHLESNIVNYGKRDINESFSDERVMVVSRNIVLWYVDFANFIVCGMLPKGLNSYQRMRFHFDVKRYYWDGPCIFRKCVDHVILRCVLEVKVNPILERHPLVGTIVACEQPQRFSKGVSIVHQCIEMLMTCQVLCAMPKAWGVSQRHELSLTPILEVELFHVWVIDFVGAFVSSYRK